MATGAGASPPLTTRVGPPQEQTRLVAGITARQNAPSTALCASSRQVTSLLRRPSAQSDQASACHWYCLRLLSAHQPGARLACCPETAPGRRISRVARTGLNDVGHLCLGEPRCFACFDDRHQRPTFVSSSVTAKHLLRQSDMHSTGRTMLLPRQYVPPFLLSDYVPPLVD